jgi:effector-binding domain-containing protein
VGYEVSVKEIPAEHLVSVRGKYTMATLALVVPRELSRVAGALVAQGVKPTGGAVAVYHGVTEQTVDVELGYPVPEAFAPKDPAGGVVASTLPAGKVLFTVHVGPYSEIGSAYQAVMSHAEDQKIVLGPSMWERYVTDPSVEPDATKYVTEIYWPLA